MFEQFRKALKLQKQCNILKSKRVFATKLSCTKTNYDSLLRETVEKGLSNFQKLRIRYLFTRIN